MIKNPGPTLEGLAKKSADGGYAIGMLDATEDHPECVVLVARGKYLHELMLWVARDYQANTGEEFEA